VGFEVLVADFDGDGFEEQPLHLRLLADLLRQGFQGIEDCGGVCGIFLKGGFVTYGLQTLPLLNFAAIYPVRHQVHLPACHPKKLHQHRGVKPCKVTHRFDAQCLEFGFCFFAHPQKPTHRQRTQKLLRLFLPDHS
jgi:hypothetical protein